MAGRVFAYAYLAAAAIFILLPIAVLVVFSFHDGTLPIPPFAGPTLRWYARLLSDERLIGGLLNSVLVAVVSSLAATVLGFLAAYGLARGSWRHPGLVRIGLLAPLGVSTLIVGLGMLMTVNTLGLPRSLLSVGVGHLVINLPVAFAICASQLGAHQVNIERAARDLGAREWQVIALITVPMIWPGLLAAFALCASFSWDEFIIAFLLSRFDTTFPVEIWSSLRRGLSPELNAAASLVFLLSVLLLVVLEVGVARMRVRR